MNNTFYFKFLKALFNIALLTLIIFLIYGILLKLTNHSPQWEELLAGFIVMLFSLYLSATQKNTDLKIKHLEEKSDLKLSALEKQINYRFSRIEKKLGIT